MSDKLYRRLPAYLLLASHVDENNNALRACYYTEGNEKFVETESASIRALLIAEIYELERYVPLHR